jgi:RNA recognition motif-containing protein
MTTKSPVYQLRTITQQSRIIPGKKECMSKKIYVGNLNYSTTEDQLEQLFTPYGDVVSAVIISDRYTNRSKGFGFVEMATEEAADAAIDALNGSELDSRQLKVDKAHERKPRDRSFG